MALHKTNGQDATSTEDTMNTNYTPNTHNMVGYTGSNSMFIMSSNMGSEHTNKVANILAETYKQLPVNIRPKIHVLDKETIPGLAYSSIVVSLKGTNRVNYYTIILESTGREPMTAGDIASEIAMTQPGKIPYVLQLMMH